MHGMPPVPKIQRVLLTPELAAKLLEQNKLNRPLSAQHVTRIENQIQTGKWKFNGDTIKVSESGDVVDGQHRLYAVFNCGIAVETIIVYGVDKDAFSTVDTLRKPRSGADVLHCAGATKYLGPTAAALRWLLRFQRKCIPDMGLPQNKIENSDIEAAYKAHPGIAKAVERVMPARHVADAGVMAFMYYLVSHRDYDLAERFINTLINPISAATDDPFFLLRHYFIKRREREQRRDNVESIALMIKAMNYAKRNKTIAKLKWVGQGSGAEEFPRLEF